MTHCLLETLSPVQILARTMRFLCLVFTDQKECCASGVLQLARGEVLLRLCLHRCDSKACFYMLQYTYVYMGYVAQHL